jgi:hypothetical protein
MDYIAVDPDVRPSTSQKELEAGESSSTSEFCMDIPMLPPIDATVSNPFIAIFTASPSSQRRDSKSKVRRPPAQPRSRGRRSRPCGRRLPGGLVPATNGGGLLLFMAATARPSRLYSGPCGLSRPRRAALMLRAGRPAAPVHRLLRCSWLGGPCDGLCARTYVPALALAAGSPRSLLRGGSTRPAAGRSQLLCGLRPGARNSRPRERTYWPASAVPRSQTARPGAGPAGPRGHGSGLDPAASPAPAEATPCLGPPAMRLAAGSRARRLGRLPRIRLRPEPWHRRPAERRRRQAKGFSPQETVHGRESGKG